jgi:ribosomal protein S13
MENEEIKKFLLAWSRQEKRKIEVLNKRRYLHFDAPIKRVGKKIVREISNPSYVTRRFFYPFIKEEKIDRRRKEENGVKVIKPKKRPLCYASHKDAFIFSWYSFILNYLYELKIKDICIDDNAIAYRSNLRKNNVHFAKEVFDFIKIRKECAVLCFDVVKFFDSLDHKIIKKSWRSLLSENNLLINNNLPEDHFAVYRAATKFSYVARRELFNILGINKNNIRNINKICTKEDFEKKIRNSKILKRNITGKGVPQGIAISSVLSNIYMINFDLAISKYVKEFNGIYRRYSDDIIIICNIDNYLEVKVFVEEEIKKVDLEIQDEKTEIRLFSVNKKGEMECRNELGKKESLQYLGVRTDGKEEDLRGKTISKFYRKISWKVKKEVAIAKKKKRQIAKRKIYKKFIHKKRQSFLSYATMAQKLLNSSKIKTSLSDNKLINFIKKKIKKYSK